MEFLLTLVFVAAVQVEYVHGQCASYEYECDDGECVLGSSSRCNGITQCSDGSDEKDCPLCRSYEYECADGECVFGSSSRCDGYTDCSDSSDEEDCPCRSYEYECDDGECVIGTTKRCDGDTDCNDGSDEKDCANIRLAIWLSISFFTVFVVGPIIVSVVVWCCGTGGLGRYCIGPSVTTTVTTSPAAATVVDSITQDEVNPDFSYPAYPMQQYSTQQPVHPPPTDFPGYPPQQPTSYPPQKSPYPTDQPAYPPQYTCM